MTTLIGKREYSNSQVDIKLTLPCHCKQYIKHSIKNKGTTRTRMIYRGWFQMFRKFVNKSLPILHRSCSSWYYKPIYKSESVGHNNREERLWFWLRQSFNSYHILFDRLQSCLHFPQCDLKNYFSGAHEITPCSVCSVLS